MDLLGAWTTLLSAAALLLSVTFPLRTRLGARTRDGLLALGGTGVGVGGLLFLQDVGAASWIAAPAFLAVCAVAHVRVLFAGNGPFRT